MSCFANPRVEPGGLLLALDAANNKNYDLTSVEVLVVAGGGGGGGVIGGGGGGGGVIYNRNFAITPGSAITVSVGDGGSGGFSWNSSSQRGNPGGNSTFSTITAYGGGGGGAHGGSDGRINGTTGGSGGGGGSSSGSAGNIPSTTPSQGNAGGSGDGNTGGGGGGSSGNGETRILGVRGGNGGNGTSYSISGTLIAYGGGGGGGARNGSNRVGGIGGSGGGGNGGTFDLSRNSTNGVANTGGGGGGGGHNGSGGGAIQSGSNGGSGIVIVRYPGPQRAIGGTVTLSGEYVIHTFTTVGSTTFTPLSATNNSTISGFSDLSNRRNFGTPVNGLTFTNIAGGAVDFDGTNDYIQTPITGTFSQISFEFWGFFDDATLSATSRNESAFGDWISNRVHFGTRWSVGMHFNVNGVWQATPTTNLRYGWNHYLLVYDTVNNLKRVYLNSILSSSNVTNGNMVLGDFKIGVATNLNAYYRGKISNFKIYNRALSAAEVRRNFMAKRRRFGL